MFDQLIADLKKEEGFSAAAYKDHKGYLTIGYGTLIDKRKGGGLTKGEAEFLLKSRVQKIYLEIDAALLWFQKMPDAVQAAMCAMAYQMGLAGLLKFQKTMMYLSMKKFEQAANEALDSKWAKIDTPERAKRVTDMIRNAK